MFCSKFPFSGPIRPTLILYIWIVSSNKSANTLFKIYESDKNLAFNSKKAPAIFSIFFLFFSGSSFAKYLGAVPISMGGT